MSEPATLVTTTVAPTTTTTPPDTTVPVEITAATLPPPPAFESPFTDAQAQAFDAEVQAATIGRRDLSSSVSVVRNGQVLHAAGFGMENPYNGTPASISTLFRLGSVSKVLTATVVMQLSAEGAIELGDPFLEQLGRDDIADRRMADVTVLELLSHASGVGKEQAVFFDEGATDWRDAGDQILHHSLKSAPGTHFQYSNGNFVLLGMLIEKVTGLTYEQAVLSRLGSPLGITTMRLAGTSDFPAGNAVYYVSPDRNFMETLGPAGGWVAGSSDIARLLDALDNSAPAPTWQPVPVAFSDAMRWPQPTAPAAPTWNYGHGLMIFPDGTWGHTGTVEQSHTIVIHRPDDITVALFVSGEHPNDTQQLITVIDDALRAAGVA